MKLLLPIFGLLYCAFGVACPVTPIDRLNLEMLELSSLERFPIVSNSAIDEELFDDILNRAEEMYAPIFAENGRVLDLSKEWASTISNAFADRLEQKSLLRFYGGFAREKYMTPDAFRFIVCHEIGHHLGGSPRMNLISWASAEGQSDYFAGISCMKKILTPEQMKFDETMKFSIPESSKKLCQSQYKDDQDVQICIRTAQAAVDIGKVFFHKEWGVDPIFIKRKEIDLLNNDQTIVAKTLTEHPEPQCRVDTIFQGALCNTPIRDSLTRNENKFTCNERSNHAIGQRPKCWYAGPTNIFSRFSP